MMPSKSVEEGSMFQRKWIDVRSNVRRFFLLNMVLVYICFVSYDFKNRANAIFLSVDQGGGAIV